MNLIKQRPNIDVLLPAFVHPGDELEAEIVLSVAAAVPVNRVTCALLGHEEVRLDAAAAPSGRVPLCDEELVLFEEGTLPAGETRHRVTFRLPADLPPSYRHRDGPGATISYCVRVVVDIPWWPDAEDSFELRVVLPPRRVAGTGPSLHTSHPKGPTGTDSYVEFTLTSNQLVPGGTLKGELALGNVWRNRYVVAWMSLESTQSLLFAGKEREVNGREIGADYDISKMAEGDTMPFAISLPEDLTPSFVAGLSTLSWWFEAKILTGEEPAVVVRVPVTVLPATSVVDVSDDVATRGVGGGSLAKIWSDVAAELDMRFAPDEATLRATVDGVGVLIRCQRRQSEGRCLVGELRFPSIGVSAGLDEASWRHVNFTSREPAQIEGFGAGLARTLVGLDITRFEDDRLVVVRDESGHIHAPLLEFCSDVLAIARALIPATRAIVAPRCMVEAVDAWQAVADRLRGELRVGDMSVTGVLGGAEVQIATHWDAEGLPRHTRFEVRPVGAVSEARTFEWKAGVSIETIAADFGEALRAFLDQLLEHAARLTVEPNRLVLIDTRAPLTKTATLVRRLDELSRFAAALRGQRGPYR